MTEFNERSRSGNPFPRTLRDPQVNNRTLRRRRNPRDRTWNRDNYAWKYSGGVAIHLQLYRHKRQNTSRSTDLRVRTRTYSPTLHRRDTYTSSLSWGQCSPVCPLHRPRPVPPEPLPCTPQRRGAPGTVEDEAARRLGAPHDKSSVHARAHADVRGDESLSRSEKNSTRQGRKATTVRS